MALHSLHAALAEVVPYFDRLVVAGSDKVWLVRTRVELDIVDALVVRLHGEVRNRSAERPDLDGTVETCRREGIGILRIDGNVHNIMRMAFIRL